MGTSPKGLESTPRVADSVQSQWLVLSHHNTRQSGRRQQKCGRSQGGSSKLWQTFRKLDFIINPSSLSPESYLKSTCYSPSMFPSLLLLAISCRIQPISHHLSGVNVLPPVPQQKPNQKDHYYLLFYCHLCPGAWRTFIFFKIKWSNVVSAHISLPADTRQDLGKTHAITCWNSSIIKPCRSHRASPHIMSQFWKYS